MATATIETIGDRLHVLHQQNLTTLTASRYWPQNTDSAKLPMIVPIPRNATRRRVDDTLKEVTRTWGLVVLAGKWESGIPTQSTQRLAETLFSALEAVYDPRDRLQVTAAQPQLFDNLVSAQLAEDIGIGDRDGLATLEYSLVVTYYTSFSLI